MIIFRPLPNICHSSIPSANSQQTDFSKDAAFAQGDQNCVIIRSAHDLNLALFDDVHLFPYFSLTTETRRLLVRTIKCTMKVVRCRPFYKPNPPVGREQVSISAPVSKLVEIVNC